MPYSVWGRTSIISMGVLDPTSSLNSCRLILGLVFEAQKRSNLCGDTMPSRSNIQPLDNPVRRHASAELDIVRIADRSKAVAWVTACTTCCFPWAKLDTPEGRRPKGRIQE